MIIGNKALKKAQSYINKCNAIRATKISKEDEANILNFFIGLQKLGILDRCEGLIIRSGQNTGTGTSLVTLNGTTTGNLTNGPLWGTNGVLFPETSYADIINFDIVEADKFSIFLVHKYSEIAQQVESFGRSQTLGMWSPWLDGWIYFDANISSGRLIANATVAANQWTSWIATASDDKKLYKNGVLYATENSAADVTVGPTNQFAFSKNDGPNLVITPICIIFNQDISNVAPQLHQLYFNTIGKSLLAFDPDAIAYINRANVTDAGAQQQINDFISGLKGLGYWDSMIECWTMRSAQNAGTGTTLYGMKGNYDGTLINGPSWQTYGIDFSWGNSTYIQVDLPSNLSLPTVSTCAVGQMESDTMSYTRFVSLSRIGVNDYDSESTFAPLLRNITNEVVYSFYWGVGVNGYYTQYSTRAFLSSIFTPTKISTATNDNYVTVNQPNSTLDINSIRLGSAFEGVGGGVPGSFLEGNMSFVALFDIEVDLEKVRSLYKNTIGVLLGLP